MTKKNWSKYQQAVFANVRKFVIYGTGQQIPSSDHINTRPFLATIQMGQFVWHLFEVLPV